MGKKSSTSQSSKFTTTWLSPRLQNSTQIIENSAHFEQISQQKQRWRSTRSSSGHACKKGDNSCQETLYSGILQQTVSGTQTHENVETSDRFKYVEHPFTCSNFQNGNSRIYQEVDSKRGVDHLDRPHRRLFSCSNTSTISKISEISDQKRGFPISGSPFWCRDSSPRVYSHCERGKTHSSSQEPQNPSISGRLASLITNKGSMSQRFKNFSEIGPRTRLAHQFPKIGIGSHTKSRFSGLSLRSSEGSGFSNPKETQSVKSSDCFHQKVISLDSKKAHVTHRDISFLRKNSTSGKVTHETFSVVPKVTLEVSPVTGQKHPSNKEFPELSQMVGGSTKYYGRCSYPSSCSQHFGVHRCLPKRLGSSLERNSPQWPLVKQGGSASHQHIGAKSCSSGPKGVSGALARSKRAHLFRQQYSSILSEQRRRHPFHRNVCSYLENSGIFKFQKDPDKSKTCTWIPKCDSRLPIKKGQGHTNRVVPSPTDIQPNLQIWHTPMVDLFATHLNYKLPIYVSPVPDKKAWKINALNICWEGLDGYVFCPVAILPQVIQKIITYPWGMIVLAPGWPGMPWFWDLVDLSTRVPLQLPHWKTLLKQPHSNRFHNNVEYLNLHVWLLDSRNPILEDSHLRWQKELRHLRGNPQEKSINQGGPFMGNGAQRIRWTSPQQLFPR